MGKTTSYKQLVCWQKAHQFILDVYSITNEFPSSENYGLTSQFRRAAVSIAANIAEGYRKTGNADKLRFYNIAQGSLNESDYYLLLSKDLKYIKEKEYLKLNEQLEEVSRLLNAYYRAVKM